MIDEKLALEAAEDTKKFYAKTQSYILDIIRAAGYYSSVVNGQFDLLHEASFRVGRYEITMGYLFTGILSVKDEKDFSNKVRVYLFQLSMNTPKKGIFGGETNELLFCDYPYTFKGKNGLRIDTFRCTAHDDAHFSIEHVADIQDFLTTIREKVDTSSALMAL